MFVNLLCRALRLVVGSFMSVSQSCDTSELSIVVIDVVILLTFDTDITDIERSPILYKEPRLFDCHVVY